MDVYGLGWSVVVGWDGKVGGLGGKNRGQRVVGRGYWIGGMG
jgi:hypothetical protein